MREELEREVDGWQDEFLSSAEVLYRANTPEEFYDAERDVAAVVRRKADELVARVLQHVALAPEHVEPAKAAALVQAEEAGIEVKSHGDKHVTPVRLLGGTKVGIRTLKLQPVRPPGPGRKPGRGKRGKTGSGVYPVLASLGITGRATPALMAEVAREMAEANSIAVALGSLKERGLEIGERTATRLTYLLGQRALEVREARFQEVAEGDLPETGEFAGKRVVIGVDGGRLRTRLSPKAGRRNAKTRHRKYKAPWKEPRVMSIYVVDDEGKMDRRFERFLDGTMGDADETLALMVGHLRLGAAHLAAHVALAADGAEWIWNRAEAIREAIDIPPERWTEVVDWCHAVEHLYEVAAIPKNWKEGERDKWLKRAKRHLNAGRVEKVIEAIEELRVGRRGKAVGDCIGYFRDNAERMRYADFRDMGQPTGSGSVESAIRQVVNMRMKGNSRYWLPEHAEAMLHLRAYLKAGRWDELVRATINHPVWKPRLREK